MTNLITIRRDDDYLGAIVKEVKNSREMTPITKKKLVKRRSSKFSSKTPELNIARLSKAGVTFSSFQQGGTTPMHQDQASILENELKLLPTTNKKVNMPMLKHQQQAPGRKSAFEESTSVQSRCWNTLQPCEKR